MGAVMYLAVGLCLLQLVGAQKGYLNYKLVELSPTSSVTRHQLHHLLRRHADQIDVFSHNDKKFEVMVSPEIFPSIKEKFEGIGAKVQLLHNNMQEVADADSRRTLRTKRATQDLQQDIETYLNLTENYNFQVRMMERFPNIQRTEIGRSYEDNPIYLLRVSANPNGPRKQTIFFDAGIHAREWIAPATANYILYQLVTDHSSLLEQFDFEIIPVLNPDGYSFSHIKNSNRQYVNRFWRKNRQPNAGTSCVGTDLNRNFGYPIHMPQAGGSSNPCSDVYSGPSALSAPESTALANYLNGNSNYLVAYFSLHSYGRYILYPWGYSQRDILQNEDKILAVAEAGRDAIQVAGQPSRRYTIGSSSKVLYVAAGGSDDYANGRAGIQYSYTIELPPNNFNPPPEDIPVYQTEIWPGLLAMLDKMATLTSPPPPAPTVTPRPTVAPTTAKPTTQTPTTRAPTTPKPTIQDPRLNHWYTMLDRYSKYPRYVQIIQSIIDRLNGQYNQVVLG